MAYKGIKLIPNSLQIEINLASLLSEHQFLQEEKLRTYAEIEELETKIEQLESDKERLREIAVGLADKLAPYRTFTEVVQPESQFVFRINGRAQLALFEADGGAWTLEAVNNVAAYLKEKLSEQEHLTILA